MATAPRGGGGGRRRRGPGLSALLVVALIVVPLAEIAVIFAVGRAIGGWPTFGLLLAESLLGAWLVKREGRTAWRALTDALRTGRMPARELADGALLLVGGTLLLTPGFLTDLAGFFFVAPPTRPVARRLLQGAVERRLLAGTGGGGPFGGGSGGPFGGGGYGGGSGQGGPDVIPGEVR
ncbi:MAG: FxsA family protein [Austwickia sp.]|jgi:UPF0716 protein FxsA|nr:MAG: FxsA family protein [Austwickia sp.]